MSSPEADVVLPIDEEGETIEETLREIFETIRGVESLRLVVSEDGSRDDTRAVLERLAAEMPIDLGAGESRRGGRPSSTR